MAAGKAQSNAAAQLEDADASISDDALAGDESGGVGRQEYRDAGDVARLAEASERRRGDALGAPRFVFPERARKVGLDKPGRDRVYAHVLRAPFGREIAHQMVPRGLGNAVGTDHRIGEQAADRSDERK